MLSVIIPAFNRCSYLRKTLAALFRQECSVPFEVIVLDTGNDDTGDMIGELFPDVRYSRREISSNRSLIRNLGAEMARGEILVFIDNDMMVPGGYLEAHLHVHKEGNNRIGLAQRRALVEIPWEGVDVERFLDDFTLMEHFPWFRSSLDDRLIRQVPEQSDFRDDWFFCYSHGLSVSRELFERAGGFDPDFGEKWGLEDVELGYRLARLGGVFEVLRGVDAYHQYHGTQFERNRTQMLDNWDILLKKHVSPETEIIRRFFQVVGPIHRMRRLRLEDPVDYSRFMYPEDLVLGCFWSLREKSPGDQYRLGLLLDPERERVASARIVRSFYRYDRVVQLEILYNALRVADSVVVEKGEGEKLPLLEQLLSLLAARVDCTEQPDSYGLKLISPGKPRLVRIILPELSRPGERFLFLRLALWLEREGNFLVELRDSQNRKGFQTDDFLFSPEESRLLSAMQFRRIDFAGIRVLVSEEDTKALRDVTVHQDVVLIRNTGYPCKPGFGNNPDGFVGDDLYREIGPEEYRSLMAAAIGINRSELCPGLKTAAGECQKLMVYFNGDYPAEAMDVVSGAFAAVSVKHPGLTLVIKVYDFPSSAENAQMIGNGVMRDMALKNSYREHALGVARLRDRIESLGLSGRVRIIQRPLSIKERRELYGTCCAVLSVSPHNLIGPEVLEALWSGVPAVLGEHKMPGLDPFFSGRIITVPSREVDLADALEIPYLSENAGYRAFGCSPDDVADAIERVLEKSDAPDSPPRGEPCLPRLQAFVGEYLK